MTDAVSFFVPGIPAPQGSKSFKGFSRNGRAYLAESSTKVAPWRAMVTSIAHNQRVHIESPCQVTLTFYLPRPKSVSIKRRPHPTVKPDLDKLIRSTLDGLTDAKVYADDAAVVRIVAEKRYADAVNPPGCAVVLRTLATLPHTESLYTGGNVCLDGEVAKTRPA